MMRYILTLLWAVILTNMTYYILGAMSGIAYSFQTASILGLVIGIFIILLAGAISDKDIEKSIH